MNIFIKFHKDWPTIVEFLLIAQFLASPIFTYSPSSYSQARRLATCRPAHMQHRGIAQDEFHLAIFCLCYIQLGTHAVVSRAGPQYQLAAAVCCFRICAIVRDDAKAKWGAHCSVFYAIFLLKIYVFFCFRQLLMIFLKNYGAYSKFKEGLKFA